MEEIWLENKQLIDEERWKEKIDSLKTEEISDKSFLKKEVKEKLIGAIEKRWPRQRFGILFSGGVDSSVIALVSKQQGYDFTCYVVGFQEDTNLPADVEAARKVAQNFNFDLRVKIFNLEEAEGIIKKTVSILKKVGKTDVVNVGVGAVVLAAVEMGKEDNVGVFFSGLGSEEIFAGYERHSKVKGINEECWRGLKMMWGRDLVRDFNLAKALGVEIKTPFLDEDLIKAAMQVPGEMKLKDEEKKIILREAADKMGLGEFAWRKKKAAQYGSCFDKAISKLARQKGIKFKKSYLDKL